MMLGSDLSFFSLILGASLPVQIVMLILVFASGMSWKYIYLKIKVLKITEENTNEFEKFFWSGGDLGKLYDSLTSVTWPKFDNDLMVEDMVTIAVQFNGKMRGTIVTKINSEKEVVRKAVYKDGTLKKYFSSMKVVKTIFIPNKLINFVLQVF